MFAGNSIDIEEDHSFLDISFSSDLNNKSQCFYENINTSPFTLLSKEHEKENVENKKYVECFQNNNMNKSIISYPINNNNSFSIQRYSNSNEYDEKGMVESIEIKQNEEEGMLNIKRGRKSDKEKKKGKTGSHTKESNDNKIRKIKAYFGKNLYIFINERLRRLGRGELLKLDVNIRRSLKKELNENLFKTTLKDIYLNTPISSKYKLKDNRINKSIITEIYKTSEINKETEVIKKILDLTYIEAFNIFRRDLRISVELKNKLEGTNMLKGFPKTLDFLKKIDEEESKKGEERKKIEEYKGDIQYLIKIFENWFDKKMSRDR
jgi:hypothetical protein